MEKTDNTALDTPRHVELVNAGLVFLLRHEKGAEFLVSKAHGVSFRGYNLQPAGIRQGMPMDEIEAVLNAPKNGLFPYRNFKLGVADMDRRMAEFTLEVSDNYYTASPVWTVCSGVMLWGSAREAVLLS